MFNDAWIMDMFSYNQHLHTVELNDAAFLNVREFKALLDRDKTRDKRRAFAEFTYIYLAIDWKSPYYAYSEQERMAESMRDSGLTQEWFDDPVFREACQKYRTLQDSNLSIQSLQAGRHTAMQMINYFTNIVDFNERDSNGKPVFTCEKVQKELISLGKVHDSLVELEKRVKQSIAESSTIRGGAVEGFNDEY